IGVDMTCPFPVGSWCLFDAGARRNSSAANDHVCHRMLRSVRSHRGRPPLDPWTLADAPDQPGRAAVVTGGSAGLGRAVADALARRGASVVLATRDSAAAARAADAIAARWGVERVRLEAVALDLASLASVRTAAAEIRARHERLDLLILNA